MSDTLNFKIIRLLTKYAPTTVKSQHCKISFCIDCSAKFHTKIYIVLTNTTVANTHEKCNVIVRVRLILLSLSISFCSYEKVTALYYAKVVRNLAFTYKKFFFVWNAIMTSLTGLTILSGSTVVCLLLTFNKTLQWYISV